jgi:hypothetical protein
MAGGLPFGGGPRTGESAPTNQAESNLIRKELAELKRKLRRAEKLALVSHLMFLGR